MKKIMIIVVLIAGLLYLAQTLRQAPQIASKEFTVTTSFYPLQYFTSQIVGSNARVINLTPAGAEPHEYELMPQDNINIQSSQLLVLMGQLEPWANKVKADLAGKNSSVLQVGDNLLSHTIENEDGEMAQDPHIWLSPKLAMNIVDKIELAVTQVDPDNSDTFAANSAALKGKLMQLDQEFSQGLRSCQSQDIITSHAAFSYLASDYGLTQVPIAGLSPDDEPSLQELTQIANFAKKNRVKYIFFESMVSPKLADTIAQEVGASTLVLNPIEGLSDNDSIEGKDYFSLMRENLANLRTALVCQ